MISLKAYAKINLGLRILGKRKDGYHEIETIFHRVNVFDEIEIELASVISLACSDPALPIDKRNLCIRAVRLLQRECNIKQGVQISLKKNIPVGAGLGGGSSDAAATLLALVKWWNINISHERLNAIALQLGSDVPYFLKEGTAYATGRGEVLEYFDLDIPYWIVLVYPNIHISTAWAYQQVLTENQKPAIPLKQIVQENISDPRLLVAHIPNDFEPLVLRSHGAVVRVKKNLYDSRAEFVQMSGSGSAVYGFFAKESDAREAAGNMDKAYSVFITPPHFIPA
ncbi:MAG: 4-(cytidine 5'-diphospho)-2-C-methyl-D-erythritol kinase [Ignavibacteria bacterium]|nr:4-(cytidine 5'-diphospho)-2-C-methyl-D-erythritol kinase [Ignavibacteria bacterium]